MEAAGKMAELVKRIGGEQVDLTVAKMKGGFDGFEEPGFLVRREGDAVLDDEEVGCR